MPTYTDSERGWINATLTDPSLIAYSDSERGTINVSLEEPDPAPTDPGFSDSPRGWINVTLSDPIEPPTGVTYSDSNRGTINVSLSQPTLYHYWTRVDGVRRPMVTRLGSQVPTAGSLAPGNASYPVPTTGAVCYVSTGGNDANPGTIGAPKRTVAAASNAIKEFGTEENPATVVLRAGTYHEGTYQPGNGYHLTWQAYPGEAVWFDGSSVITGWTANGTGGWTTAYTAPGVPALGNDKIGDDPYALLPDMLFMDGEELYQIADGTVPAAGQFSVNRTSNTITVGTNPSGHVMRVSDLVYVLFSGSRVNLKGLGFRRYRCAGSPSLHTAFYWGGTSQDTVVENCWFEQMGRNAMYVGKDRSQLKQLTFKKIGQTAVLAGDIDDFLLERSYFHRTDTGKWKTQPTSGAIKLTVARRPVLRYNVMEYSHNGNQMWLDVSCTQCDIYGNWIDGTAYDGSTFADSGICYEECEGGYWDGIQYKSHIVGNTVLNCHKAIVVCAAGQVYVANNTVKAAWTSRSEQALLILQDRDINHGGQIPAINAPWWNVGIILLNNRIQPQVGGWQLLAYDSQGEVPRPRAIAAGLGTPGFGQQVGGNMLERVAGNWFSPAPGTTATGIMATIGQANGNRININTPAALEADNFPYGLGANIETNYQSAVEPSSPADHATSAALPAEVAVLLGMSTGAHYVGNPLPKPNVEEL